MMRYRRWVWALIALSLAAGARAEEKAFLAGHVPAQLQTAVTLAPMDSAETLALRLVVQLDPDLLAKTLDGIYGPGAPAKKHFLSAAEFAQVFGIAEKRKTLKAFAQANHLTLDATDDRADSMIVKVSGSVSDVNRAFGVHLSRYRDAHGLIFHANDTPPAIPASLTPHLGAVLGLSNAGGIHRPHHRVISGAPSAGLQSAALSGGTGPGGTLAPADIKTIYGLSSVALTGSGQTVALVEFDGYDPNDISTYETVFALPAPAPTLTFVGVDGTANLCQGTPCAIQDPSVDGAMVEVALDIEMVLALAPQASQILVYDAPNSASGSTDMYDKIASDNLAQIVSTSWGSAEKDSGGAPALQAEALIFQRMAAQGQTMFAAAGDCGAYDEQDGAGNCVSTDGVNVDDPASQPYVTGAGGTSLSGTLQSYTETTWNDFGTTGGATGGGVSAVWALPSFQAGVAGAASQVFRNVPDVALNSDPVSGYAVRAGRAWFKVGGTSAAAPLWAAFTALINQQRVAAGSGALGFANPTIYSLATGSSYATLFNDVTSGNNPTYSAGTGYDNVTGWGSFKGSSMISSISNLPTPTVSPPLVLGPVIAYPNPWDIRHETRRVITFANVASGATVKIYTLAGQWVKTLQPDSTNNATWDLTTSSSQMAASGLYFYDVSGGGQGAAVRGKIAIIK